TLNGMTWRFVGPYRGGRTLAVSGVAGDAKTFYLGAVDGGVWKTINGGESWQPLFDGEPVQSIGALEVAPSNPDVVYVGTGEGCLRNDISYGNGVYKSIDAGKTWTHIGLDDSQHIPRLAIDPKNPDRVFVAALGHASGPNDMRGVYRTLDGGATWQRVLFKDDKTGAVDLSFDPADSNIIYAALYQQIRTPWSESSGGPGSGLYKSTDGGDHWTQLTGNGLPDGVLGKIGIAVGADSKTVYAQIEAKDGGLYVSKDAGATWSLVNADDAYRQRAWYFTHVFADPKNPDVMYELNTGVFRSTDGGKTFHSVHGADSHGIWIDPGDPNRMITSNDGGASITQDVTAAPPVWTSQANQPTAQFYHVDADTQTYWELYGEQQDAGSAAIPSHTNHNGIFASDVHSVGGGESGWAVPSPDGKYVYAGNYMSITRWEKEGEPQLASINPWPENSMCWGSATLEHRFQWTAPIALSPFNPSTVYYGGEILYKSTDRGSHWTKISPDLTRNDKSKQKSSGGPVTQDNTSAEYYDTLFCIAESPKQPGLIWVGTDDGLVQVTRDGGKTWTNVTPPELKGQKQWAKIAIVAPSPFEAGTVYVAARRNKMDDFAPYVYRSTDYGRTWKKIVTGIPMGSYVNSVKPDTKTRGLLYAGTELGPYVSFNNGASWQSLQFNLPHASIRDLVVHDDSLAIATHGRAFWI
ncbi:MAG: WD40/YVTN/BNR-like repeat-containing protein, partial [Vicinamibacterales bacterium]